MNRQQQNPCDFCLASKGRGSSIELFQELYGGANQIVTIPQLPSAYTVLQDLIPLGVHGAHLLLLTNPADGGHDISLALAQDQCALKEAHDVLTWAIRSCFPHHPICVFEHGPGFVDGEPIACGGCHVDHAHGHMLVLPPSAEVDAIIAASEEALASSGWSNVGQCRVHSTEILSYLPEIAGINPYLHFGFIMPGGKTTALTYVQTSREQYVESQLFRRIVANVVYGERQATYWNWRDISSGLTTRARMQELQHNVAQFHIIYQSVIGLAHLTF